ncbi:DUF4276 family protein [Myxococcota bacterium]|nr:DUF4276 family protein [Myxococcota bacterium]MBU1899492.1 DUF4276 family protein [Myxococcota bacterium]
MTPTPGGYASWLDPSWRVIVLLDRDDSDCHQLKAELEQIAHRAGLVTRSVDRENWQLSHRIVVEELEAWFFGDWAAVCAAYPRVSVSIPQKQKYRTPDEIRGGTWETLERLLQRAGYFKSGLRKSELARMVSAHMRPELNRSESFKAFYSILLEVLDVEI